MLTTLSMNFCFPSSEYFHVKTLQYWEEKLWILHYLKLLLP